MTGRGSPPAAPEPTPPRWRWHRGAAANALRSLLPLAPPGPVFGLVLGLLISESDVVGVWAGWASTFLVYGGASQLAAVLVLDAGGGAALAVATILVVNARHVMYSAALQPRFRDAPRWFRILGPYLLVDQVFATTEPRPDDDPLDYRLTHYLAGGAFWWSMWVGSVGLGIVISRTVGDVIPESWSLEFSVPLLFLGLLVNAVRDRPGLAAALVSAVVAVALRDVEPAGSGLLAGALGGLAAATALDRGPAGDADREADR